MKKIYIILLVLLNMSVYSYSADWITPEDMDKVKINDTAEEVIEKIGEPQYILPNQIAKRYLPKGISPDSDWYAWFYQNAEQKPLIIIEETGGEAKVEITKDEDILYLTGGNDIPEAKTGLDMEDVITMQKTIQKGRNLPVGMDFLIIFVNDKVKHKTMRDFERERYFLLNDNRI